MRQPQMKTFNFILWIFFVTLKLASCATNKEMNKQFVSTSRNLDPKNIFFRKFESQEDGVLIVYDPTFLITFLLHINSNQTGEDQSELTDELTNIIKDPDFVVEHSEFKINLDSRFKILKNCLHCNFNHSRFNSVNETTDAWASKETIKNSSLHESSNATIPHLIATTYLISQSENLSTFYNLECIIMEKTKNSHLSQLQKEIETKCIKGFNGRNSFRSSSLFQNNEVNEEELSSDELASRSSFSGEIIQSEILYKFSSSQSITMNIKPTIDAWLQKTDVYNRNFQSLTFMLRINRIRIQSQVISLEEKIQPNTYSLSLDYKYDRRCYLPTKEGCPFGACSSANRICKFRKYCPQNDCGIACSFEDESKCDWKWDTPTTDHHAGFHITTGKEVNQKLLELGPMAASGPIEDSLNQTDGHFLLLSLEESMNQSTVYHLESPWFLQSDESCYMEAKYHMYNMDDTLFKLVLKSQDHSTWVPMSILGNKRNIWESLKHNIGKFKQRFQVILEIASTPKVPSHFAIDNIRLVNCFPSPESCNKTCSSLEFQCSNSMCINRNQLCDFEKDCPNGEDELQDCHRVPENTTCNFELGWCGWSNVGKHMIKWEITNRPSSSNYTGPKLDHTYQNSSGHYLVVDMKTKDQMLTRAVLLSPLFAKPPAAHYNTSSLYYNSCQLDVEMIPENSSKHIRFWQVSNDQGNIWHRASSPLPKIDSNYHLQITASRAVRGVVGDIAIDDISLSRECSGGGIPSSELRGYIYVLAPSKVTPPPENTTRFKFTTCNNNGSEGPTEEQCVAAYKETTLNTSFSLDHAIKGVQVWTVPQTNYYTLIAKGASGGNGAIMNQMTSHGSSVKVTVFLREGEKLYVLVGQEGASICEQNGKLPDGIKRTCFRRESFAANFAAALKGRSARTPSKSIISELSKINKLGGGGGGGGGGTFVFKMVGNKAIPLLVAAGGGGLAYNASSSILPYGKGTNVSSQPHCGSTHQNGAGGGGGWEGPIVPLQVNVDGLNGVDRYRDATVRLNNNATKWISAGMSVLSGGGIGGQPCVSSMKWGSYGGFGGGGGGCEAGGGGGGYQGGSAHVSVSSNGEGGVSYIFKGGLNPLVEPGVHNGPGELVAIPAFTGCTRGCEYKCVLLDDYHTRFACVCPENWILTEDGTSCLERDSAVPAVYLIIMITVGVLVFLIVGILCFCLYNRYQRQKVALLRRKVLGGPELQLSRLRAQSGPGGVLTEYNPNYEFGGETYTLTDLKEIPRENLRLVKALGQGAFGEVYQGFYKHRAGDAVEMPVAVKTLPELSSNQAEMDFLMEALIMSKFNHPNIVHFIGVCFDKHPRFIILELLAGGDLKTFLRESGPKPERASPLTMKDLLLCALDVAKGCKYLEENHFIHRDIAARNCLLTTKGPGRVVKIADFGMARDIYRADYYKKGGKAMLPVKWMPPEAFLDGIFTSKTDVWSYGVLLWEVLSLGYMPYPGRGNQDVMQLVTNGGRLEPPTNCPTPVYGIMTQCWHPMPEDRPTFTTLLERVGYCLQDPEVVNAPLPVFQRPPSSERDVTLMRPTNPDDSSCLRIVHGHRFSNAMSISTEPTTPTSSTADYLVPLTPYSFVSSTVSGTPAAADSNVSTPTEKNDNPPIPDSQSTSTLLDDDESPPVTNIKQNVNSSESNPSSTVSIAGKRNGIENGVTLNPISLDKSRRPAPYVNVGVKKSIDLDRSDEEIRC